MKRLVILRPKCGTMLTNRIMMTICQREGWKHCFGREFRLESDADFWVSSDALFTFPTNEEYLGIHLIRDPRAIIVSWYFFTLMQINRGVIHKEQYLHGLDQLPVEEGLTIIMTMLAKPFILDLYQWEHPTIKTFKYEDIMTNYNEIWPKIFHELQIDCEKHGDVPALFDLRQYPKEKLHNERHVTNKEIDLQRWKQYFTPTIIKTFQEHFPADIFKKLGYPEFNSNTQSQ